MVLLLPRRVPNLELDLLGNASNVTNADLTTYDTQYKSNVAELRELISRITVLEGIYFNTKGGGAGLEPLCYSASTFHKSMHCDDCVNEYADHKESYIIDCDYIKTSFPSLSTPRGFLYKSKFIFPAKAKATTSGGEAK